MRRTSAPTTLVALLATVLVLGIVPCAQAGENKECSNATLHGSFGFTVTGFSFSAPPPFAGPFGQVGRQTFDGNGITAATATTSANGNVVSVTLEGTYTVNPDCTGSFTITIFPLGLTQHINFVIDDDGLEFRAISADPGDILTGVGKKQFPRGRNE
jgi:hypothetical protein